MLAIDEEVYNQTLGFADRSIVVLSFFGSSTLLLPLSDTSTLFSSALPFP